jgi:hypothetical protein
VAGRILQMVQIFRASLSFHVVDRDCRLNSLSCSLDYQEAEIRYLDPNILTFSCATVYLPGCPSIFSAHPLLQPPPPSSQAKIKEIHLRTQNKKFILAAPRFEPGLFPECAPISSLPPIPWPCMYVTQPSPIGILLLASFPLWNLGDDMRTSGCTRQR